MVKMGQKMAGCIEWYDDTTTQLYNNWIRVKNDEVFFLNYLTFLKFYYRVAAGLILDRLQQRELKI